jgi:hypothetical protein
VSGQETGVRGERRGGMAAVAILPGEIGGLRGGGQCMERGELYRLHGHAAGAGARRNLTRVRVKLNRMGASPFNASNTLELRGLIGACLRGGSGHRMCHR